MGKRSWSLVLSIALVAGAFSVLPARAQGAPGVTIPEVVQITDPKGDANGLNDQDNAYGTPAEGQGDQGGPAGGTATDILKVWFTNTAADVSLNIQVNADPGTLAYDTYFRFSSNAGEGSVANDTTRGCLQWIASVNGAAGAYNGPTEGNLTDKCNVGTPVMGPLVISPADEGFVITVTFPRSYSPLLGDGLKLTAPFGVSRVLYANGLPPSPAAGSTAAFVTLDNTKRGSDYTLVAETVGPGTPDKPTKPKPSKPGKAKPKPKPKKPKKPKPPKPPKPPATPPTCPAFAPGDLGKDAKTTVVTDAATAEAPVVVEFDSEMGGPSAPLGAPVDLRSLIYQNVQVDSAAADAGLYVRIDFPEFRDYDVYLKNADGSDADFSGDTNLAPGELGCGGTSCEGGTSYESILGIRTKDCAGYTTEIAGYMTEGGKVTLSMWLGESLADPTPPGALQTFYSLMGL